MIFCGAYLKRKTRVIKVCFVCQSGVSTGRICLCECEHRRIGSHQLYLSIIRVITQETRTQRAGQQLRMKALKHIHPPAYFTSPPSLSARLLNFTSNSGTPHVCT